MLAAFTIAVAPLLAPPSRVSQHLPFLVRDERRNEPSGTCTADGRAAGPRAGAATLSRSHQGGGRAGLAAARRVSRRHTAADPPGRCVRPDAFRAAGMS